jgi:hypothetical protein
MLFVSPNPVRNQALDPEDNLGILCFLISKDLVAISCINRSQKSLVQVLPCNKVGQDCSLGLMLSTSESRDAPTKRDFSLVSVERCHIPSLDSLSIYNEMGRNFSISFSRKALLSSWD